MVSEKLLMIDLQSDINCYKILRINDVAYSKSEQKNSYALIKVKNGSMVVQSLRSIILEHPVGQGF